MKPKPIKQLQALPVSLVGDGKSPNVFFVTNHGVVITVTREFSIAYNQWREMADMCPRFECALEDRKFGCIACVQPEEDGSKKLIIIDDSNLFLKYHPQPKL